MRIFQTNRRLNISFSLSYTQITLLLITTMVIVIFLFRCGKNSLKMNNFKDTLNIKKDYLGTTHYFKEYTANDKSDFNKKEVKDLVERLKIKEKNINGITSVKGSINKNMGISKVDTSNNSRIWQWHKNNYEAIMDEKDSTLRLKGNLNITIADYIERHLFKRNRLITDIFSDDEDFTINSMQVYRRGKDLPNKKLGLGISAGYGINSDLKLAPYVGVGINYNIITIK